MYNDAITGNGRELLPTGEVNAPTNGLVSLLSILGLMALLLLPFPISFLKKG